MTLNKLIPNENSPLSRFQINHLRAEQARNLRIETVLTAHLLKRRRPISPHLVNSIKAIVGDNNSLQNSEFNPSNMSNLRNSGGPSFNLTMIVSQGNNNISMNKSSDNRINSVFMARKGQNLNHNQRLQSNISDRMGYSCFHNSHKNATTNFSQGNQGRSYTHSNSMLISESTKKLEKVLFK